MAPMLEACSLWRSFSRVPVVRGVSFGLWPGEICGYLGPNGSGKTTTVRMLASLLRPSAGDVLFHGESIAQNVRGFRARLGYVPEEPHVYPHLSAVEYLELAGGLRGQSGEGLRRKIQGSLDILGLGPEREALIGTYSKGMKQKVLLIAALLHDPEVLIFDEPLSGLDAASIELVGLVMQELARRGKAVLYSSHLLGEVEKLCTRVIVLFRGEIAADDSIANLAALVKRPSLGEIFAEITRQPDQSGRARELADLMGA